jgi:hypothetical protein
MVLAYLKTHPHSTSAELTSYAAADRPDLDRYLFSRRLADLQHAGLATKSGERVCAITHRACITWLATEVS